MMTLPQTNILIVTRIKNHSPVYEAIASSLAGDGAKVIFAGSSDVIDDLKEKMGEFNGQMQFLTTVNKGVAELLKENRAVVNGCAVVIFDEYYGRPASFLKTLFIFQSRIKKVLIVHNAKTWLLHQSAPRLTNFFDDLCRRLIIKRMDAFLVMSASIKEYVEEQSKHKRHIFCIPFKGVEGKRALADNKEHLVSFCIPGVVSTLRRDYSMVLDIMEELWRENRPVQLKLLGCATDDPKDRAVMKRCKELSDLYGSERIRLWEKYIPDDEFDREALAADIILFNNRLEFSSKSGAVEILGQTKESGMTLFIINFAKPALIPESLKVGSLLENQMVRYADGDSLKKCIIQLTEDQDKLEKLKANAKRNAIASKLQFAKEGKALAIYLGIDKA